jgi:hypothetical protein
MRSPRAPPPTDRDVTRIRERIEKDAAGLVDLDRPDLAERLRSALVWLEGVPTRLLDPHAALVAARARVAEVALAFGVERVTEVALALGVETA